MKIAQQAFYIAGNLHFLRESIKLRGKQRAAQIPLSRALESSLKNVARAAVLLNTQKGLSGTVYVCFCVVFLCSVCRRQHWDIQRFAVMLRPYVRAYVTFVTSLTNVKFYIHFYIDIYVGHAMEWGYGSTCIIR